MKVSQSINHSGVVCWVAPLYCLFFSQSNPHFVANPPIEVSNILQQMILHFVTLFYPLLLLGRWSACLARQWSDAFHASAAGPALFLLINQRDCVAPVCSQCLGMFVCESSQPTSPSQSPPFPTVAPRSSFEILNRYNTTQKKPSHVTGEIGRRRLHVGKCNWTMYLGHDKPYKPPSTSFHLTFSEYFFKSRKYWYSFKLPKEGFHNYTLKNAFLHFSHKISQSNFNFVHF